MQDQSLIEPKVVGARKTAMAFTYVTIILDVLALVIIIPVRLTPDAALIPDIPQWPLSTRP